MPYIKLKIQELADVTNIDRPCPLHFTLCFGYEKDLHSMDAAFVECQNIKEWTFLNSVLKCIELQKDYIEK